ncbi:MAG: iron response transcriptional regulator IrrA [Bosea sp. (in: a-proteobacteria)]
MTSAPDATFAPHQATGCDEISKLVREVYGDKPERPGCPISAVRNRLRDKGLRPTRQRVLLGWMLFGKGNRHVSAEELFAEATRARASLSLATVYNTLHQFTEAGLLRQVQAGPGKAYFDTNTSDHHHFVVDGEETVFDMDDEPPELTTMPKAPPGFAVMGVDVIVRLRRLAPE